jgi:chromosome segregation ATPase
MTQAQDLETQRAALDAKLTKLRMSPVAADLVRKADAAVNSYRAEADALEAQIAEIDAQLGVRENDRRAAAAQQRETQWLAQRQALLDEEETRLVAIADAEAACRALVDAITRTLASHARLAKIAQALETGHKVPTALNVNDLVSRIAGRISSLMAQIPGHRSRLGALEWTGGSLFQADRSWRQDEERRMAAALIQPLLTKGKA